MRFRETEKTFSQFPSTALRSAAYVSKKKKNFEICFFFISFFRLLFVCFVHKKNLAQIDFVSLSAQISLREKFICRQKK